MQSPSNSHIHFLATWLANQKRPARLAKHFLEHAEHSLVALPPELRPQQHHFDWGLRTYRIFNYLGLDYSPLWQLPDCLRDISPPPALFVRGDSALMGESGLSIVGSRKASDRAKKWAYELAFNAAREGRLVISGGALGIDAAAHRGALDGGGRTVAYIGAAVDRCYPMQNRALFAEILERGGAIISEYAPGISTPPYTHAQRNRFIAAAAEEVFVVAAAQKSGALGTAAFARRLGRPVLIPPHSPQWGPDERAGIEELLASGHAKIYGADE